MSNLMKLDSLQCVTLHTDITYKPCSPSLRAPRNHLFLFVRLHFVSPFPYATFLRCFYAGPVTSAQGPLPVSTPNSYRPRHSLYVPGVSYISPSVI